MDLPNYDIQAKRDRLSDLERLLSDPSVLQDQEKMAQIGLEYNETKGLISLWDEMAALKNQYDGATELMEDPEYTEIAESEIEESEAAYEKKIAHFKELTIPKLPDDEKSSIIEIRAGTGGTEASLFAEEIMRMYLRYLSSKGMLANEASINYQQEGGIKEAIIEINTPGSFGKLRYESGVHRVQRVPSTESGGRIHTSAVSVAVLPQVKAEDVNINPSDIKIDVYRSSGPGGQSVNTTDSAVRLTHLPTGITVSCQDGKSQHKNKDKAMQILASKLYEIQQSEAADAAQAIRQEAVKSGDRSVKIRTYNFPQGRVTDHRTKDTWYSLPSILEGELDEVIPVVNRKLRGIE